MSLFSKTKKLLVVEDDPNNHLLFRTAFEEVGFDVNILGDADGSFVEVVALYKPDLISMDLMIGHSERKIERDGFDAIELLRADERTKGIPIIVLTNYFQEDRVYRAQELGVVDYVILQGNELPSVAERYKKYLESPRKYIPVHEVFRGA